MPSLLPDIKPDDLQHLAPAELEQLAEEVRSALSDILSVRTAHFASNLGVVELCIALHCEFDFLRDRLIWDTGHQVYPHKLITGRYKQFHTIRTKGGLMGYPNPAESDYDLFMTGHAGSSVATALGLKSGDDFADGADDRQSVAVIGDGALPSGIVYEAMNNAASLNKKLLVILNDNRMSICPRVGAVADYLEALRDDAASAGETPRACDDGQRQQTLFQQLGFEYLGPIDGHDIQQLRDHLQVARRIDGPVLLHVLTEKGHGFQPAAADPVKFHTPAPFASVDGQITQMKTGGETTYTHIASDAIHQQMSSRPDVTVISAAMCQGNKLERVREQFPDRLFDVGICESHAVAFAAGQAKAGMRPIVGIYSTFLQRSFDQVFQEVALQNLPVTFLLDRAGLTGPDGPTHHGVFDLGYLRILPNMTVMAPGDAWDLSQMVDFALQHSSPTAIRYPKTGAERLEMARDPIELGRAEVLREGRDGTIICCGTLLTACCNAADLLLQEGLEVGVINARFLKPLDVDRLLPAIDRSRFVVTVEEAALMGGFGSAVVEAATDAGLNTSHIRRLGIPDQFVEHGTRAELLAELGLDANGIRAACLAHRSFRNGRSRKLPAARREAPVTSALEAYQL